MDDTAAEQGTSHTEMTAEIVAAYVTRNHVQIADLPALISSVYAAIGGLGHAAEPTAAYEKPTPAQIKKSITSTGLTSFIDGKPYKTLKRHLTKHGLDPASYRERYGLPLDYPMTSTSYSEQRSALARSYGLGRPDGRTAEPNAETPAPEAANPEAPKMRGRPRKAATSA